MSGRRGLADDDTALGKAFDAHLARRIAPFVAPYWRWLVLALAVMPLATAAELAQPYLLKIAIDRHIAAGRAEGLPALAALFVACAVAAALLGFVLVYALQHIGQSATADLRLRVHRHLLGLRAGFYDRTPVGRLVTRLTGDIDSLQEMFAFGAITILADLLKLAGIVVMLFVLHPPLALLSLAVLPLLALVVELFRRRMRTSFRTIRAKVARMNAYLQEHVGGIKVVQAFAQERAVARGFRAVNDEHRRAYLSAMMGDASLYAVVESLGAIAGAAVLWYGGWRVAAGALTFGVVVAYLSYVEKFFGPVRDLAAKYAVMQAAMASAERIFALLDTREPDAPVADAAVADAAVADAAVADGPAAPAPAVEFDAVEFAYAPGEPVLRGVSFRVARGETLAIVGTTGSGKSTVIKLLSRLYEPTGGAIRLDGRDVRTLPREALRRRITVVPQDGFLFAGTVRDNLGRASPGAVLTAAEEADLVEALRRVRLDEILRRRGGGLATIVSERGGNFSAGERQLLAFARALVRDPEILVLDEATAQVDPEAETRIEAALRELLGGRTSIVIAHRLSTIRRADRVLVLARGRVVEEGTHDELLARGGRFARLHELSRAWATGAEEPAAATGAEEPAAASGAADAPAAS